MPLKWYCSLQSFFSSSALFLQQYLEMLVFQLYSSVIAMNDLKLYRKPSFSVGKLLDRFCHFLKELVDCFIIERFNFQ